MKKGRITSNIAGVYKVYSDGIFYTCSLKGLFRHKNKEIKVGDFALFDEESLVIVEILERKNEFLRPSVANVDIAFIVNSIEQPRFSKFLVLKYLTYVQFNAVTPVVIFTKSDLKEDKEIDDFVQELRDANIKVFITSINKEDDILQITDLIEGKTALFFGQTGEGKSSLINKIDPCFNRLIGEYSYSLNRGKHRTKETILLPKNENTFYVDSPGFSSLELNMAPSDIRMNFPIILKYGNACRYDDCKHISEPECAVKKAVLDKIIPEEWYNIYVDLMEKKDER